MKIKYVILWLAAGLSIARGGGMNWPANQLLPTFPAPASNIDCIDVSPLSDEEVDLFASLQGIVNRTQPRIACVSSVGEGKFTWLNLHKLNYDVVDPYATLLKYKSSAAGLVVTDPDEADTLNLATTIAGVKNELICDPGLLGTLTNAPYGFSVADDLRGRFTNKYQVYGYMFSNYWPQCTHRLIAGMAPNLDGNLRDYLVANKVATVWLDPSNANPQDQAALAMFLTQMTPAAAVYMGWWPSEANGLNYIGQFGIPVLASDYLQNASLFSGVPHKINTRPTPPPPPVQNKVYLAMILSDGDNIQYMQHAMKLKWSNLDRGSMPLGWTISPLSADLDPTMLNYYWNAATSNDCLVSGPSGAGYTHMQEWNRANLDAFSKVTDGYLRRSGLRIITIWDKVTAAVAQSFATNCPTLLGLTDQSGGTYSTVTGNLRTLGLSVTYSSDTNSIYTGILDAARSWNGTAPLFIAIEANVWNIGPTQLRAVANSLDTNKFVLVRPDQLFMMHDGVSVAHSGLPADRP